MKRFLGLLVVLLPISVVAETIQLVTVLPSPVGSFFRLETADTNSRSNFSKVSFGENEISTGEINLIVQDRDFSLTPPAVFEKIQLSPDTTLKSNTLVLDTPSVAVAAGNTIKGGRLFATLNLVDDTGFAASGTLYAPTGLKVSVANVKTLWIGEWQTESNEKDNFSSASSSYERVPNRFVWSNKLSATNGGNGKEYLLTVEN